MLSWISSMSPKNKVPWGQMLTARRWLSPKQAGGDVGEVTRAIFSPALDKRRMHDGAAEERGAVSVASCTAIVLTRVNFSILTLPRYLPWRASRPRSHDQRTAATSFR